MKTTLTKELPILGIVLLPFLYLAYVWNSLPEEVPVHWNAMGEIDGYGARASLVLIPFALPFFVYIIFLAIPKIDPKGKIYQMENKFQSLKLVLVSFMSLLAVFIIHSSKEATTTNMSYVIAGLGVLFIILGNYMKTIKPNYFLGIRTPWTLENDQVWKATHKLAGKLWFIGGFAITVGSLLLSKESSFIFFIAVTLILALVPLVYSYVRYKKEQASA